MLVQIEIVKTLRTEIRPMLIRSHEVYDMFNLNVETNKMGKIHQLSCIILIVVASSTAFKIYRNIILYKNLLNFLN